ncbi:uncharacterized protein LOC134661618 [Cydia amplana]|uniref:uncharacterized protein LOC134661618 n=1 Tax=Cydia amplana TaxID=1869771 RepID=UPI002FE677AA
MNVVRGPPLPPPALAALLVLLAAGASPRVGASDPTVLLLLRAACVAPHPEDLFSEARFHQYALSIGKSTLTQRKIRILNYEDTCGPKWRELVTSGALSALSAGGAAVCAGWAGAGACGALAAAARALRRPQPAACAALPARAAAAARLAASLRWRRVLLPPAAGECAVILREVARAITAAGLAARRSALSLEQLAWRPHVVILCAPHGEVGAEALAALRAAAAAGAGPAVLLLQLDQDPPPPSPITSFARRDAQLTSIMSNITLAIRNLPYTQSRENLSSNQSKYISQTPNLSSNLAPLYKKSFSTPLAFALVNNITVRPYRKKRIRQESTGVLRTENVVNTIKNSTLERRFGGYFSGPYNNTRPAKQTFNKNTLEDNARKAPVQGQRSNVTRSRRSSGKPATPSGAGGASPAAAAGPPRVSDFNSLLLHLDAFQRHLFLLRVGKTEEKRDSWETIVYNEVIENLNRQDLAERTRTESSETTLYLYQRIVVENGPCEWEFVTIFNSTSTRSLDDTEDWSTIVEVLNSTYNFEEWAVAHAASDHELWARFEHGMLTVVFVCCALMAAAAAALVTRYAATRRRRRRRRGDAVLLASDFTFPADERRRVGEGMETMLSCWLQQLHEFGGPELERPDLLKQSPRSAPPPAAAAPSAPSSTCSVNRLTHDRRTRYKGDAVHVKYLPSTGSLEIKRKATDVLLVMQTMRHENLNPFIGCLCELRPALVFDACGRGSLEDVLMADDIKLDWTFRLSLLTDLVKGMRYVHSSSLRQHGRLSSRNCVVDSRWVLRITDYGLPSFYRAQGLPQPPRAARELLWTAPEILREEGGLGRGSQPGDVFSFAIIMQEVIVRGEPYCMLALTPGEIVEKIMRPPPLIRPSVSMGAAPPEAVSVMRQCWSEAPDLRPDFHTLHDIFRHMHRGRKINIVDSMFEMLEKYSNNLEELIKERTEQLDMEKKKTEQLLNRMLPRSVAERLILGLRVEPEEFEDVSIYFSDIVGFTALAARATPVQVVDLLNDLYTVFDDAIEQYRVYKVETIGDAYMVVGGLPTRAQDHAESIATMALHLLHLAGRFRIRHAPTAPLHLRIGLHTGPCCAGVVGLTMPRYCLFGDTVNTASRMESTGAAWRIQISATTAERLTTAGGYRLRSRGLTQIKGKGAMHTYWLLGKEGFDKPLPTPPPLQSEEILFEADSENDSETMTPPSQINENATNDKPEIQVQRQRSDASTSSDKFAWQRSGAVSADSSPPPRAPTTGTSAAAIPTDLSAPYSRYRCLAGGPRGLRRQWSLERGDALAVAAGARGAVPPTEARSPPIEPLALLAPAAPRATAARYRTRPDAPGALVLFPPPPAPSLAPPTSEEAQTPNSCPS